MRNMKIEKAEKLGLCFGVRRAIELLKETANKYGELETLGPLAHNRLLVEESWLSLLMAQAQRYYLRSEPTTFISLTLLVP